MDEAQLDISCQCSPVVDAVYRPDTGGSPVEAVVDALARAAGTEPTNLKPLYDAVDTEALNQLFADREMASDANAVLCFQFETWNVFVRDDGRIRVCDAIQSTEPEPVFENNAVYQ